MQNILSAVGICGRRKEKGGFVLVLVAVCVCVGGGGGRVAEMAKERHHRIENSNLVFLYVPILSTHNAA